MSRRFSIIAALLTVPAVLASVYIVSKPEQDSTTWVTWAILVIGPSVAAVVPLVTRKPLLKMSLIVSVVITSVTVLLGIVSVGIAFVPALVSHSVALGHSGSSER